MLQRIALCYGIAAFLLYYLKPKTVVIISIVLMMLYWGLLIWLGETGNELTMTGNVGLQFDNWLMGEAHFTMVKALPLIRKDGWEPWPAIGNVVAGFIVGQYVQQKGNSYEGLTKLLLAGVSLIFMAWCWNFFLPINKKLWTGSFVLYTVGLDCIILSAVIYIIEFLQQTGMDTLF